MNRFFAHCRVSLAAAVLTVLALTASRAPAGEIPFSAEGTFTFVIGGGRAEVSGDGHAGPGGAFTFRDTVRDRHEHGTAMIEGMITLNFASGSTLTIYYEAPNVDGVVEGPYWVVGGTGLFEGATGYGTIWYPIGQGAPFTLDGELEF